MSTTQPAKLFKNIPTIKIDNAQYPIFTMSFDSEDDSILSVSYRDDSETGMTTLYGWDFKKPDTLESKIRYPRQSSVLKGEDMQADPDYKSRLREFSQQINPKDEAALAQWMQKKQKGGKDL